MNNTSFLQIPYNILKMNNIKLSSKILLAEILSLDRLEKGCYASNAYFAERIGISDNTVRSALNELKSRHYVTVKIINYNQRRIYPAYSKIDAPPPSKTIPPLPKIDRGGGTKSMPNNNIDNNIYNNSYKVHKAKNPHKSSFNIDELEEIL